MNMMLLKAIREVTQHNLHTLCKTSILCKLNTRGDSTHSNSKSAHSVQNKHPMQTRLRNNKTMTKQYTDGIVKYPLKGRAFFVEPVSHLDALVVPQWKTAMDTKFSALQKNKTWQLVPRPLDQNIV